MPFSSIMFMFAFLPAVVVIYFLLSFSRRLQNIWIFVASIVFYAFGQTFYVIPLLFIILVCWIFGLLISKSGKKAARILLIFACCLILGNLIFFKYATSIRELLGQITGLTIDFTLPDAPLGISFYTLHALAYCISAYEGVKTEKNPIYTGLYIAFFPKMIAGPIARFEQFSNEIRSREHSLPMFSQGVCRFAVGFVKLNLLAYPLANIANTVFIWSAMGRFDVNVSVTTAWLGLIAYTLQIYLELSGYADMAIGIGRIFGFLLPDNFNQPYSAISVTDFWRRWHITLTAWFREYVYIPIGKGKFDNKDAEIRNLLIIWLLIGLWHGNGFTNLFFGVWFFLIMLAEHFFEIKDKNIPPFFRHVYTLLAVMIGWVLLRTENLYQAGRFFMNLTGLNFNTFHSSLTTALFRENIIWLFLGLLVATPFLTALYRRLQESKSKIPVFICGLLYPVILCCTFFLSVIYMLQGTFTAFPFTT